MTTAMIILVLIVGMIISFGIGNEIGRTYVIGEIRKEIKIRSKLQSDSEIVNAIITKLKELELKGGE